MRNRNNRHSKGNCYHRHNIRAKTALLLLSLLYYCSFSIHAQIRIQDLPRKPPASTDIIPFVQVSDNTTWASTVSDIYSGGSLSGVGSCSNSVVKGLNAGTGPTCGKVVASEILDGTITLGKLATSGTPQAVLTTDNVGNISFLSPSGVGNDLSLSVSPGTATWTVSSLRGNTVSATTPSAGQFFQFLSGVWTPHTLVAGDLPVVTPAKGGTGIDTSAATGTPRITSGTWTVNAGTGTGLAVLKDSPTLTDAVINQAANGDIALKSIRVTDSTPAGYFISFQTAALAPIFTIDAGGAVTAALLSAPTHVATDASGYLRWLTSGGTNYVQSGTAFSSGSAAQLFFTDMFNLNTWFVIGSTGNIGIGTNVAGTSATHTLAFQTGICPTTSPASIVQVCATPSATGANDLYARNEAGKTARLTGNISRVATQFDKTTNTTLADITGLTINTLAGKSYTIEADIFVNADTTGGGKFAIAGTATATSIIYNIEEVCDTGTGAGTLTITSKQTALGGSAGQAGCTVAHTRISGLITVNAAGTITAQFAQNASSGTSSVLVGSWLRVAPVGD